MRARMLVVVSLVVLLTSGVLQAMEEAASPDNAPRASSRRGRAGGGGGDAAVYDDMYGAPMGLEARPRAAKPTPVTRVFSLRYYPAGDLASILEVVARDVQFAVDAVSDRLIVTGPLEEINQVARLIEELDVPKTPERQSQAMMCRVYMLELPSPHAGMRPFSIVARGSSKLLPAQILSVIEGDQVQIMSFRQKSIPPQDVEFFIQGRATSSEIVRRFTEKIPGCQIEEFAWEEETPVLPTTRVAPLPKSLQEHIRKFLGEGAGIVGYWFGNLSVPGSVGAPIGPWTFSLDVEQSGQEGEPRMDLEVEERRGDDGWVILSNSLKGKIGRPVIVGYNRDRDGVQTMGALVVITEPAPDLE